MQIHDFKQNNEFYLVKVQISCCEYRISDIFLQSNLLRGYQDIKQRIDSGLF